MEWRIRMAIPARSTTLPLGLLLAAVLGCTGSDADEQAETPAPEPATAPAEPIASTAPRVTIQEPAEGAEVSGGTVMIRLGAENVMIAPAGDSTPGTGHHHLFVNQPVPAAGEAIPAGVPGIVHLGKAQTEHQLTNLAPGDYVVIAVIGDLVHRRIEPQVMDTVRFRIR